MRGAPVMSGGSGLCGARHRRAVEKRVNKCLTKGPLRGTVRPEIRIAPLCQGQRGKSRLVFGPASPTLHTVRASGARVRDKRNSCDIPRPVHHAAPPKAEPWRSPLAGCPHTSQAQDGVSTNWGQMMAPIADGADVPTAPWPISFPLQSLKILLRDGREVRLSPIWTGKSYGMVNRAERS